jgi:hypothetical protein
MSFMQGLLGRVTEGFENKIAERRAKRQQEEAMRQQMQQQQMMFEQQQRQKMQALPNEIEYENKMGDAKFARSQRYEDQALPGILRRERARFEQDQEYKANAHPEELLRKQEEMEMIARVRQAVLEKAKQIPIKTTPGLREALIAGDMNAVGKIVRTQSDVDFINVFKSLAKKSTEGSTETSKTNIYHQKKVADFENQIKNIDREVTGIDKQIRAEESKLRQNNQKISIAEDELTAAELAAAVQAQAETVRELRAEKEMKEAELGDLRGRIRAATGGAERPFSLGRAPARERSGSVEPAIKRGVEGEDTTTSEWKPSPEAKEMVELLRSLRGDIGARIR